MPSRIHVTAIDAFALKLALQRMANQSMGNGVTDVFIEKTESRATTGDEGEIEYLMFTVERYAMNGTGFHVGYEKFTAALPIFHGPDLGIANCTTPHSKDVVFPASMEISEITPAQEPHTYTPKEALAFIDDWDEWSEEAKSALVGPDRSSERSRQSLDDEALLQIAHDLGMSEGDYTPPDDDFAWQKLDYHLNEALADLPTGQFDPKEGAWSVKFRDGEVAHEYEPVRVPGVKYER